MNGRRRLTWVTALTVASLLLGSSALSALAEGHGGGNGDHGASGQAKSAHQEQDKPAVVNQAKHDGESHAAQPTTAAPTTTTEQASHEDEDNNKTVQTPAGVTNAVQKHQDDNDKNNNNNVQKHQDDNNNVQRLDDDNEDLVTPPARVTEEDRPGLGCGDDNHTHTGAPGNPDNTCKPHGDDDQGVATNDDASAAVTVAGATAVGDTGDGD